MLQRERTTVQHHPSAVGVAATQGHGSAHHHSGVAAQRGGNLARLRHQHTTAHCAAQRHCLVHRHRAACCSQIIGGGIHQQRAAAHLNAGERTICGHILQYLAYRYSVTARHHIFCEIRGCTGRSKTILAQHQGKPRGQVAVHQLCSAAQHLATLHHLQAIPFSTGKAAFPGVAVHIDKRSIQFRQFSDATHIHLAAQRQNTCRSIGNGRLQRQRAAVLHLNAADSRRGQRVLYPLGSNFQRSIRQAHRSDAQCRGRSGHHRASQY